MPTDWAELSDTWWSWHVMRALASTGGLGALVLAVFIDRLRNG